MSRWHVFQFFPAKDRFVLPNKPCVYAVYFDDELVYIGQTNRLSNRFSGHAFRYGYGMEIITPWGDCPDTTRIYIKAKFSIRLGDWAMWEIRLIHRLQPKFNTHHRRNWAKEALINGTR